MHSPFRDDNAFAGRQIDAAVLEIDQKLPTYDIKKLIFVLMLVPMILALDHTESHDRFVYLAEGLVVPAISARIDQAGNVDDLKRTVQDVESGVVGKTRR
jgi:hypothetical protein